MKMYETMLSVTDETHLSFVDKIFDNEFGIKNGVAICPLKLVFTDTRDDILDILREDDFFVLDIEKFIFALKCRILERVKKRDFNHEATKIMFDFLRIKQLYPYALKIYIHVYSYFESIRETIKDVSIQSLVCSVSGQFYSEIRECRGSLTPDLFIKLYEVSPFEVTRKLNQLVSGFCYDRCFDVLKTEDNDKVIARFLLLGGYVYDFSFFAKWAIKAYPKEELDDELVLGLVNVLCSSVNRGIEFKIEDYKNFIFEILDKKVDKEIKVGIILKLIDFYRKELKDDTRVLVSDVIDCLSSIDSKKSVMMLTNFVLKL